MSEYAGIEHPVMGPGVEPTSEPGRTIYRLGDAAAMLGTTWDRANTAERNERVVAETLLALLALHDKHPEWGQSITWMDDALVLTNARHLAAAYGYEDDGG